MKKQRHSIKDIASALNVSVTTVSFIINGKAKEKRISEKVTKKVLAYIDEINYKPNQLAQSLRTGQSKIIVFMVEDISNYFFARLARIIEDIAYEKGYKVLFCSNDNEDKKSEELIALFKDRQVDGYIIIPSSGIKGTIKNLLDENIPLILFDRYFEDLPTNYVVIDNEEATLNATNHLIENKFKNIAFVTTDVEQTQMLSRLSGYKKAVGQKQLHEIVLKIPYNAKPVNRKAIIKDFIINNPEVDAVFFATNYLTQDGISVIKEGFPSLLSKLGIITFDDNTLYEIFTPSISAVAQPLEEICGTLMSMMLKLLKKKEDQKVEKVVLNAKLLVRESSLPK
ncbi:LacI family transcriptional regulator [Marivirga lumbricoides]|uniref:LacI family transcriptional regulator n=1 Tax=Marivirga lumbricoides TaxID=1046115 RepID=A0ABQ1L9Y1_9BACT|nr:LacI family transcriptional regulator [Marivirga lumbricoides]